MKSKLLACSLFIIIFIFGCRKDNINPENLSCQGFTKALINNDAEAIKETIDIFLAGFIISNNSTKSSKELLEALAQNIDNCPEIDVSQICYACIYTGPPKSVIKVEVPYNGNVLTKYIILKHDLDDNIFFGGLN